MRENRLSGLMRGGQADAGNRQACLPTLLAEKKNSPMPTGDVTYYVTKIRSLGTD